MPILVVDAVEGLAWFAGQTKAENPRLTYTYTVDGLRTIVTPYARVVSRTVTAAATADGRACASVRAQRNASRWHPELRAMPAASAPWFPRRIRLSRHKSLFQAHETSLAFALSTSAFKSCGASTDPSVVTRFITFTDGQSVPNFPVGDVAISPWQAHRSLARAPRVAVYHAGPGPRVLCSIGAASFFFPLFPKATECVLDVVDRSLSARLQHTLRVSGSCSGRLPSCS